MKRCGPKEGWRDLRYQCHQEGVYLHSNGSMLVQVLRHQQLPGQCGVLLCLPQSLQNRGSQILFPLWMVWPSCTFPNCHFMNPSTLNWSKRMCLKSETEIMKMMWLKLERCGIRNYKTSGCNRVWVNDFLIYYNNLDVGPFVQVMEKMQQF